MKNTKLGLSPMYMTGNIECFHLYKNGTIKLNPKVQEATRKYIAYLEQWE
jgi:hypothetical protein